MTDGGEPSGFPPSTCSPRSHSLGVAKAPLQVYVQRADRQSGSRRVIQQKSRGRLEADRIKFDRDYSMFVHSLDRTGTFPHDVGMMPTLRGVLITANGLYRDRASGRTYLRHELLAALSGDALGARVYLERVDRGRYTIGLEGVEGPVYDLFSRRRTSRRRSA